MDTKKKNFILFIKNSANKKYFRPVFTGLVLLIIAFIVLISDSVSFLTEPSLYRPDFSKTPQVEFYDLNDYKGDKEGWRTNDRVVFCVPLRDAAVHLPRFFSLMSKMSYPHNQIDLTFLVSDSKDNTLGVLKDELNNLQQNKDKSKRFGSIEIYEKDFGQVIGQSFSDRHGFAAQGPRRKLMARARNWLGSVALKPYHSWVHWRDVDVEILPDTILEDLIHHDKDVIVPNVWRPLPDWLGNIQPYDLNSWKESDGGLQLADSLSEDAVIVEGYPEYATWRPHLAYMRDPSGDPEDEVELDGIGGVSIMAKAKVFRAGSHYPAFSFKKHAETEAFGKLSRTMGFSVVGLPNYVVWHIYEPSSDDLKHMEWMAEEEERINEENKIKEFYERTWEVGFEDMRASWEKDFHNILKNVDHTKLQDKNKLKFSVDWEDTDADYNEPAPQDTNANGNDGSFEDYTEDMDEIIEEQEKKKQDLLS